MLQCTILICTCCCCSGKANHWHLLHQERYVSSPVHVQTHWKHIQWRLEHTESSVQELCSVFSIHLKWKNTVTIVHDHFFIQVGIQLIHMIRSSTSSHWLNFTHGPDTAAHSVAVMVISGTGMQTGSVLDWEACPTRSRHFGIFCLCPHLWTCVAA